MINDVYRRILIGMARWRHRKRGAGVALHHTLVSVLVGIALGMAYSVVVPSSREAYVDKLMSRAAMGIPLWA